MFTNMSVLGWHRHIYASSKEQTAADSVTVALFEKYLMTEKLYKSRSRFREKKVIDHKL